MKSPVDMLVRAVAPLGAALAVAPRWVVVAAFLFALADRVLPRDSKDLLTLWLRILPRRHRRNDKKGEAEA